MTVLTPAAMAAAAPSGPPRRFPRRGTYLALLGTRAGPPIQMDRFGIGSALVVDGATYVVDCGRGVASQYIRAGLTLASLEAIFLTHLHADHVADYYNFFMLGASAANTLGDVLTGPVDVYGPGPAGALPAPFGGGDPGTVASEAPTPGTAALTADCHRAYAYSTNLFMRDSGMPDIRTLMNVHEIQLPDVGAVPLTHKAPRMQPFVVMEDERVKVTAVLVPHGPVFPSFAFRFDTDHGSVTFSGDTTYTENIPTLAHGSDILVHEAINLDGASLPSALYEHMLESHVEVQKVGHIAQASQAPHLILSHIGDLGTETIDTRLWRRAARAGYDGQVTVGEDLQHFALGARRR
ncbi:MBL fold metallo-hydrolase [Streptomyces tendae]|uniref:MBL fold metallo-hydrolase n=1 Tax=Streptomyces tendae TaxID=1932 RepID=UPI003D75FC23